MNIFHQIRGFYSVVFANEHSIRPIHSSLYFFLLNQANRNNWNEWVKVPFDTAMAGACINSNKTYYRVLNELVDFGLIEYVAGVNNHKAPKIKIIPLNVGDENVPKPEIDASVIFTQLSTLLSTLLSTRLSTPLPTQLATQLSTLLSTHKDILITYNKKQETESVFSQNEKPIEFPEDQKNTLFDSEQWRKVAGEIAKFFSISEMNQPKHYSRIGNFVRLQESRGRLDYLRNQFNAYRQLKTDPKYIHKWDNYIGTPEESYEDGAWNKEDWVKKLISSNGTIGNVLPDRKQKRNT